LNLLSNQIATPVVFVFIGNKDKTKKNDTEQRQEEAYSIMKDIYNNNKIRKNSDIFGEFVAFKIENHD